MWPSHRGGIVSHYKSNVRDQVFNLFEVLGVDKALGQGAYADLDADTATEMLNEMVRLAEAPRAAVGPDRAHPRRQPRRVHVRDGRGHGPDSAQPRHRGAEEVGSA